jgi:hypothetical protein
MKLAVLAAIALLAPTPPFPAPKFVPVTAEMKCDWGPIASLGSDHATMVITTEAGALTLKIGSDVKVAGTPEAPKRSLDSLRVGENVRVYYLVDGGANLQEVDVIAKP